jgi:hypothetical protein
MAKKNIININSVELEDLIWMSYRYCIGRHTITAVTHADTIKSILKRNPNAISPEKREFMANDIRDSINSIIKFNSNIKIKGFPKYDVYSDLLYEISKHDNPNELIYHIDAYTHEIKTEPLKDEKSYNEHSDYDYIDLIPWIKLANYLDKSTWKKLIVNVDGETKEIIAFPYPCDMGKLKFEKVWTEGNLLTATQYIPPKSIVEIKDIEEE